MGGVIMELKDLNIGDKVTLDDGDKGYIVALFSDNYLGFEDRDMDFNIVIQSCVCPHGMNPFISVPVESIINVKKQS